MISEEKKQLVLARSVKPCALGGYIGTPYEQDGCVTFVKRLFRDLGENVDDHDERTPVELRREFDKVDEPEFGDVVVFQELPFADYHVGMMLDSRWAIQSSPATNGAGRIEITRMPWEQGLRGFYRLRSNRSEAGHFPPGDFKLV